MFDHRGRSGPGVPEQVVEVGHMDQPQVGPVGHRMPGDRHVAPRRVVLEVDGGNVDSGAAAEQLPGQFRLVGPLQDDDVDLFVAQPVGGNLDGRGGPVPGAGPAAAVGATVRA